MPWERGYKIQVIYIPLQHSLLLELPIGIHCLVLCRTVWRYLLHSVLSLAKRGTYFTFPTTWHLFIPSLDCWSKISTDTALGCCTFFFRKEKVMEQTHRAHIDIWVRVMQMIYTHRCTHTHVTFSMTNEFVCSFEHMLLLPQEFLWETRKKGKEGKKERKCAAVADSIRHAGLQCKLLYGHRCGFYGRNTGLF